MTTELSTSKSPPLLSAGSALLTDFDGTLVELAEHPDAVSPSPDLPVWLSGLQQHLGGALAIVTGRRLAEVDRYLAPFRLTGAGAHGAELRWAGDDPTTSVVAPLETALVAGIESALADLPGVWVENKTYALAAHFRQNPAAAAECHARVERVAAGFPQVKVFGGHAVVEVRSEALSKGTATQLLLSRPPFAGRVPVFVGDDFADEEAFRIVQAAGGHGVKVGDGASVAHYRLPQVAAVHRWMRDSLAQPRQALKPAAGTQA